MSLLPLHDNKDALIADARAVLIHLSTFPLRHFMGIFFFPQRNLPRSKLRITEPSVRCLNTRRAGGSMPRTGNIGTSAVCRSRCPSNDVAPNEEWREWNGEIHVLIQIS